MINLFISLHFTYILHKKDIFNLTENKVQEPKTLAETMAEAERRIARQNSAIDLINTIDDNSVSKFTMILVK